MIRFLYTLGFVTLRCLPVITQTYPSFTQPLVTAHSHRVIQLLANIRYVPLTVNRMWRFQLLSNTHCSVINTLGAPNCCHRCTSTCTPGTPVITLRYFFNTSFVQTCVEVCMYCTGGYTPLESLTLMQLQTYPL